MTVKQAGQIPTLYYDCGGDRATTFGAVLLHSLPLFCSSQEFMTKLVSDLLCRGNDFLLDEDWERAAGEFSKGLDIWHDVREKKIHLSEDLLEWLYVGRAAAYHSMVRRVFTSETALQCSANQIQRQKKKFILILNIILIGNTRLIVVQI